MILTGGKIREQAEANAAKMRAGEWPDPAPEWVEAQERSDLSKMLVEKPEGSDQPGVYK